MPQTLRDSIFAYTDAHPSAETLHPTAVGGLMVIRGDRDMPSRHRFYEPALFVVAQGTKDMLLGDAVFTYSAGQYLVLSVGLPAVSRLTGASKTEPYLAMVITIDLPMIHDLMRQIAAAAPTISTRSDLGLFIGTLDAAQSDAASRIAALLETPDALRVLYPSIVLELFYWLVTGPEGANVRRLVTPDGNRQRIAAAIDFMRAEFAANVPVERLAAIANMSPSTFHHHFKAVTSMSPLQFHKQLRLLEARKLMLTNGADAARAAYEVGYESASQFSREYARMFGAPPRRDTLGSRTAVG